MRLIFRRRHNSGLLLALLLLPSGDVYAQAAPHVTVQKLAYHGWPHAVRLSNGLVEAYIVPRSRAHPGVSICRSACQQCPLPESGPAGQDRA